MAGFAMGLGMIFSSLTTKYRDLVFLLTFGIQLYMYVTPVVYTVESVPDNYKWIVELNPLTAIFICFKYAYLGSGNFEPISLFFCSLKIFILLFIGVIIFNKVEKNFMDTV
jgi:lipopolysaccharide transport system permease protein